MISFITSYKDCLKIRKKITIDFFKMMEDEILPYIPNSELIVGLYDNSDNIQERIKNEKIIFLEVEPNEDQPFNISKALNACILECNNAIVAPVAIDFRFKKELFSLVINFFVNIPEIVLRPQLAYREEDGEIDKINNVPFIVRKADVIQIHGWDERLHGWGKEDDDIISRLIDVGNLICVSLLGRGVGYEHVWHTREFTKEYDGENTYNYMIAMDNVENKGKNLVNSFW